MIRKEEGENPMDEQPTISDELRVALMQVWALGFIECVAGGEVTDDDLITTQFGAELKEMAAWAIDEAVPTIAPLIQENPTVCYQAMYESGFNTAAAVTVPSEPISLN